MRVFDMHHSITTENAVDFTESAAAAPVNSVILDTAGYESLEFIISVGTVTVGGAITIEHGDDSALADAEAVSEEETLGSVTLVDAESERSFKMGYIGKKRYVRLVFAAAIRAQISAVAVRGTAHSQPTADTSGV